MARKNHPSTIDRLPKEIRDVIARLRQEGRTIDEILAGLRSLDQLAAEDVPSRSALGRHLQNQKVVMERVMESRQLAEALATKLGDKQSSEVVRMNLELLQDAILRVTLKSDGQGNPVVVDPKDLMFLATALEKAAKASKSDFDQQLAAVREIERRETKEKAAEVAANTAKKQGLSAPTIAQIKASILGMK